MSYSYPGVSYQIQNKDGIDPIISDKWKSLKNCYRISPKSTKYRMIFPYDFDNGIFDSQSFDNKIVSPRKNANLNLTSELIQDILNELQEKEIQTKKFVNSKNFCNHLLTSLTIIFLPIIGYFIACCLQNCYIKQTEKLLLDRFNYINTYIKMINETKFEGTGWFFICGQNASWLELINHEQYQIYEQIRIQHEKKLPKEPPKDYQYEDMEIPMQEKTIDEHHIQQTGARNANNKVMPYKSFGNQQEIVDEKADEQSMSNMTNKDGKSLVDYRTDSNVNLCDIKEGVDLKEK